MLPALAGCLSWYVPDSSLSRYVDAAPVSSLLCPSPLLWRSRPTSLSCWLACRCTSEPNWMQRDRVQEFRGHSAAAADASACAGSCTLPVLSSCLQVWRMPPHRLPSRPHPHPHWCSPNYLTATIEGDLHILFYRTVAGRSQIQRLRLPPRAAPKVGLHSGCWLFGLHRERCLLADWQMAGRGSCSWTCCRHAQPTTCNAFILAAQALHPCVRRWWRWPSTPARCPATTSWPSCRSAAPSQKCGKGGGRDKEGLPCMVCVVCTQRLLLSSLCATLRPTVSLPASCRAWPVSPAAAFPARADADLLPEGPAHGAVPVHAAAPGHP